MMIERLIITLLLVAAGSGAYLALARRHSQSVSRLAPPGGPALLYFRGDHCAACSAQGRYLEQLMAQWPGRITLEIINAEADVERAAGHSVFTLPTTMVVDRSGAVRHINYGLADAGKLGRQLESLL
jgi:hypothetical protein